MADQVNPLGNLAPGLPPTSPAAVPAMATRPPSTAEPPPRPSPPPADAPNGRGMPASAATGATLNAAVQDVQKYLQQVPADLQFKVDKASGQFVFKVVNPATKEVIRQVPSEEVLAMARKLRALDGPKGTSGVLMDKEG